MDGILAVLHAVSATDSLAGKGAEGVMPPSVYESAIRLGEMSSFTCRDDLTILGECRSFDVATFKTYESGADFTVCFLPSGGVRSLLRKDEALSLIKHEGEYYILGDIVGLKYMGMHRNRAATRMELTDCNPND